MKGEWLLVTLLDGIWNRSVWQTQNGAIADRERQLFPRRIKDHDSPTGYRTIWPSGWTAISRMKRNGDA